MKKKIYFAHPLRGSVDENKRKIGDICREAVRKDPAIVPLSPIHNFSFLDPEAYDAAKGMELCFNLLFLADELWVFGDYKNSEGCQLEMEFAYKHHIPIRIGGIAG